MLLATTRLIPLHTNKNKTISQTLTKRINYSKNPDKTQKGELVTNYECNVRTADMEFVLSEKEYAYTTRREQRNNDIIAYHLRQAFKPGEIDPETANKVGYELAMRFTKGRHAFIVSTHTDKEHVHNHIIFNSIDLNCTKEFKNFWNSSFALRKLNDLICVENGLSIIENPSHPKKHYSKWLQNQHDKKKPTNRENLQGFIDEILEKKPSDFEEFLEMLQDNNCEVKRGKHISLRLSEQKSFIRLRTLSDDYSEKSIQDRISKKLNLPIKENLTSDKNKKINLLIDIQNSIKAQNSPGYERFSKIFNLKQAAGTLIFLQENEITDIESLQESAKNAKDSFNDIQNTIHFSDARLKEISILQKHIRTYIKTKDIYVGYRKAGYSKKFLAKHEAEITAYKNTRAYFNEQNFEKFPTIKLLQQEYAEVLAEKKKAYSEYHKARKFMKDMLTAKQNTEMILNYDNDEQEKKITNQHVDALSVFKVLAPKGGVIMVAEQPFNKNPLRDF